MRAIRTIAAATLVITLAACGGGNSESTESDTTKPKSDLPDLSDKDFKDLTADADPVVQARDNNYVAQYVTVKAGATVKFINKGRNQHDVLPAEEGAFVAIEKADFNPGDDGTITFDKPGDYPYYCTLHGTKSKGMVGAVRVLGS